MNLMYCDGCGIELKEVEENGQLVWRSTEALRLIKENKELKEEIERLRWLLDGGK